MVIENNNCSTGVLTFNIQYTSDYIYIIIDISFKFTELDINSTLSKSFYSTYFTFLCILFTTFKATMNLLRKMHLFVL